MMDDRPCFIYLPGAGGAHEANLQAFAAGFDPPLRIETLNYPGWKRYLREDFSSEKLMEELTEEIERRCPHGPIFIIGVSIGGHFGYAICLRLQQRGREIAVLCAIDSFVPVTTQPSPGWQGRATSNFYSLLKKGRWGGVAKFVRVRAWRMVFRFMEARFGLRRNHSSRTLLSWLVATDIVAERELSMRLLLRDVIPWIGTLDHPPARMIAPAAFLRTVVSSRDDQVWQSRCPDIAVREIQGTHHSLFEPENVESLRKAFISAVGDFSSQRLPIAR